MEKKSRGLTILLIPDGSRETRTLEIPYHNLRWALIGAGVVLFVLTLMIGSWWYLAVRAQHARVLEVQVAEFLVREEHVQELAGTLAEVEAAYEQLRSLFGIDAAVAGGDLWLPPGTGRPAPGAPSDPAEDRLPTSWPLTERGFITQTLLEGGGVDHPGIDIAVPSGSYIRAAGGGTVLEAAEDPIYGHYLVLDHGQGYHSLYAHASLLLAEVGDPVRRNEIIALSGTSGRSTAPHLHFEILHEGAPVDPLSLVSQP